MRTQPDQDERQPDPSFDPQRFGDELLNARRRAGMLRTELCRHLGVSDMLLKRAERGDAVLALDRRQAAVRRLRDHWTKSS